MLFFIIRLYLGEFYIFCDPSQFMSGDDKIIQHASQVHVQEGDHHNLK